ncbi:carbohydrate deacetylase [Vibrio sp. ZSDE26]|uniref:Carbohydrate deacetylase n=1 Tax=Vibrio amylolyticus TaxID=2847292 RepID=A0A9X1XLI2_9VIBR|nr:carbohydrate deacetylase [Vibrio amylolyticus]MCK6264405.1 carbohydrate deacetylase [Vibrio amylolyticus]
MKLIMNADDFGLTQGVNNAIASCFKAGIVKSTTIMMNQEAIDHAARLYHQGLIPEVGLHFTVTTGKPILSPKLVPSLVDENGNFHDKSVLIHKTDICEHEVYQELAAQYQSAIDAGFNINHIDSHHFGGVYPALKSAFVRFANEIKLPVRRIDNIVAGQQGLNVVTPDIFDMRFFDSGATAESLKQYLLEHKQNYPSGVVEFMCHPSVEHDQALPSLSGYTDLRARELEILCSTDLKDWLNEQDIECVGFDYLAKMNKTQ